MPILKKTDFIILKSSPPTLYFTRAVFKRKNVFPLKLISAVKRKIVYFVIQLVSVGHAMCENHYICVCMHTYICIFVNKIMCT